MVTYYEMSFTETVLSRPEPDEMQYSSLGVISVIVSH